MSLTANEILTGVNRSHIAGCDNCKQRRVKCDGTLPECCKCVERHLKCPGYATKLLWKKKHQVSEYSSTFRHFRPPSKRRALSKAAAQDALKPNSSPMSNASCGNDCDPIRTCSTASKNAELKRLVPCEQSSVLLIRSEAAPVSMFASAKPMTAPVMPHPSGNLGTAVCASSSYKLRQLLPLRDSRRTELTRHYFRDVCVFNSCYDSAMNPLRTRVQGLMGSSRLISLCILSMSAAHLCRLDTRWALDSMEYFVEAVSTLTMQVAELASDTSTSTFPEHQKDQILLGIVMLGMSTSWHASSGLGLEHIAGSRTLFQQWIYCSLYQDTTPDWSKYSFYLGLQAYWEAVASFLVDHDVDQLMDLDSACRKLPTDTVYLHPWTGLSSTLWVLLAKAGCIARSRRNLRPHDHAHLQDCYEARDRTMRQLEDRSRILEEQLLTFPMPSALRGEDTHDERTPISHLKAIARCCRLAALLELYQAFGTICDAPSVLTKLVDTEQRAMNESASFRYQRTLSCGHIIIALAIGILSILRSIPRHSNTRCLHPLLLLIAGSALSSDFIHRHSDGARSIQRWRYFEATVCMDANVESVHSPHWQSSFAQTLRTPTSDFLIIHTWRNFVSNHALYLEQIIRFDSIRKIRSILESVWTQHDVLDAARLLSANQYGGVKDDIAKRVHWIDIMEEQNLHFLF